MLTAIRDQSRRRAAALALGLAALGATAAPGQTLFTEVAEVPRYWAAGIAVGDYDNDGWPDLFPSYTYQHWEDVGLYHNEAEAGLRDRADLIRALVPPVAKGGGPALVDYDNDGDLDLFVATGWGGAAFTVDRLLRNDRGAFTDVTFVAGLTDSLPTDNALWFDHDLDGHLDLYVGHTLARNVLYHNNGDGTFSDRTRESGLDLDMEGEVRGGSSGGMSGADFDGDGWPDLYLGAFEAPNRLFLNDGQGRFVDATGAEVADPGQALGVAVGDIDNDGDIDIFQAAGGGGTTPFRSRMLLNLGEGAFLDVTDAVGLTPYLGAVQTYGPALADLDNDGDLDLLTATPALTLLNDRDGIFTDATGRAGLTRLDLYLTLIDVDLDGFLDVVGNRDRTDFPRGGGLYRNAANGNHWLQVELVGVRSNRNGIGARVVAESGDLRQTRQILGGDGHNLEEPMAHFGLGERTRVDRLEIHWPSGQVDAIDDLPVDRRIRVLEGGGGYQPVVPSAWVVAPPAVLAAGVRFEGELAVRPALFDPGSVVTGVVADLSGLGGPAQLPLQGGPDGTWRAAVAVDVTDRTGHQTVAVMVDQATSLGPRWTQLSRGLLVAPAADEAIVTDGPAGAWQPGPPDDGRVARLGFVSMRDGSPNIELIDADGRHRARLTQAAAADVRTASDGLWQHNWDWSPDGRRLVVATAAEGALVVMNPDGTGRQRLTFPPAGRSDYEPSWSADGGRIAFVSDRSGDPEIYAVSADGGEPVRLTVDPAVDENPQWSPDGTRIAFASDRAGKYGIYLLPADGGEPARVRDSPNADLGPSWSPDGARIAFVSFPLNDGGFPVLFQGQVFAIGVDGAGLTQITDSPNLYAGPAWSPDGRRLAIVRGFAPGIYVVELAGGPPVELTPTGVDYQPVWLPAGAAPPVRVLDDPSPASLVQGRTARVLQSDGAWLTSYEPRSPRDVTGYRALGFALHPGDARLPDGGWLTVRVNQRKALALDRHRQVDLLDRIDLHQRTWQEVEVPLEAFDLDGQVTAIELAGNLTGTFYLADLRLVTAVDAATAVAEEESRLPGALSLAPNYPNPFNGATAIPFSLPSAGALELAVYDLLGQRVTILARGPHEAGTYTLRWDGTDDAGRPLASGVYLCRLQTGDRVASRKLLLLR